MPRIVATLAALVALSGCAVPPAASEPPDPAPAAAPAAPPADGVLLSDLGFRNAPAGFSLPETAVVEEAIDADNNITVVLTHPAGAEIEDYLRRNLAGMGFTITADGGGSLLFESPTHDGAFTVTDGLAAVSLRTDRAD